MEFFRTFLPFQPIRYLSLRTQSCPNFRKVRSGSFTSVISAANNINSVYGSTTTTDCAVSRWYRHVQQENVTSKISHTMAGYSLYKIMHARPLAKIQKRPFGNWRRNWAAPKQRSKTAFTSSIRKRCYRDVASCPY